MLRPNSRRREVSPRRSSAASGARENDRFPPRCRAAVAEDSADGSRALRSVAEVGLSARTRGRRGTARTLAGSVRYDEIYYTGFGGFAYLPHEAVAAAYTQCVIYLCELFGHSGLHS